MNEALRLAANGPRRTSPNPKVGAVIVHNNRIVGRGFHQGPGTRHAELHAVHDAASRGFTRFSEAEIFCTLEPCSHKKKRTLPCAPLLIEKRFKRVVVAHHDPNPQVSGRGISALRRNRLKVSVGCLKDEASLLNQVFIKNQLHALPYVTMKLAMTFDGRMADDRGVSQWITGPKSQSRVHEVRSECDGILVGSRTIDRDNPRLNTRIGRQVSSQNVFIWGKPTRPQKTWKCIQANGPGYVTVFDGKTSPRSFLKSIYRKGGICHLLIEGGPTLASLFLEHGLVDRLILTYGRGLLLDRGSYTLKTTKPTLKTLNKCLNFKPQKVELLGWDLWIEGLMNVYRPH